MGYRSDVLAVLASVHKPEDLVNAMEEFRVKRPEEWALLQNKFRWKWSEPELLYSREKGILFLECHDVKWYDDYPDVAAWNKLWDFCRDEVEGISGNLWRLGEDNGDIYNGWFGDSYVTDMIRFERNVFFDMYS